MVNAPYFKLALTRAVGSIGGPDLELATLEEAVRFVGLVLAPGATALGFRSRAAAEGGTHEMGAEAMIEHATTLIVFGIAVLSLLGALWPIQYGVFACYGSAFCEVVPGYGDTDGQSCYQMAYLGNQVWATPAPSAATAHCCWDGT
jgi:hypothetical protein